MQFPHCEIEDTEGLLWVHVSLLSLCAVFIVSSFISQFADAAPYGRHAAPEKAKAWGFPIPQRIGHMVSDAIPGVLLCLLVYLLYAGLLPERDPFSEVRAVNVVLLCGWLLHYLYRGFVHPLIMPYSSPTVAVGITLAGIFPNSLFTYLNAAQLACTVYPSNWASQPRFIIGVTLYGVGTIINRWADLKLRAGRLAMRRGGGGGGGGGTAAAQLPKAPQSVGAARGGGGGAGGDASGPAATAREALIDRSRGGDGDESSSSGGGGAGGAGPPGKHGGAEGEPGGPATTAAGEAEEERAVRSKYFIPRGGLFELISCPNYLGELIEWTGYALAVWSWPSLAWALFCASTFIPRSLTNHRWYKEHFGTEYPPHRRALVPFLF